MKCRNRDQGIRRTCNNIDYDNCVGCPVLCSWDNAAGWYVRCNNVVPIKFGETILPLVTFTPCHRRKDKYAQHENDLRGIESRKRRAEDEKRYGYEPGTS